MPPIQTIWHIEPHTQAKHAILERYLKAWLPIMSRWNGRILYIDGFAGPGKYLDKNNRPIIDGSPLIAINAALKHKLPLHAEIVFIFIELDPRRCEHLKNLLTQINLPNNLKYEVMCEKFDETLSSILNYLDEQNKQLAPTFAFIDPFGYSDTPFSIIKRIMKTKKCEVLITFMYKDINRFLNDPDKALHFDSLFGTDQWRSIAQVNNSRERKRQIHELYHRQLKEEAKVKYVRSFEMINEFNQTIYFLYFGTNSLDGLKQMKAAMWKIDPYGAFRFSDRTDPNQAVLFEPEPNFILLEKTILTQFKGKTVSIEEIERFVLAETAFRETHIRNPILKPTENAGKIGVSGRTRKGTYPQGTVIQFF